MSLAVVVVGVQFAHGLGEEAGELGVFVPVRRASRGFVRTEELGAKFGERGPDPQPSARIRVRRVAGDQAGIFGLDGSLGIARPADGILAAVDDDPPVSTGATDQRGNGVAWTWHGKVLKPELFGFTQKTPGLRCPLPGRKKWQIA